jgi:rhodanese-related sulfurtransferase
MSAIERVSPQEAQALLSSGGGVYTYVDVRSEPEFEQGHPPGALNVPFQHRGPAGLVPNPEFVAVIEAAFDKDARLLLGCQSGGRSRKAAAALVAAGFSELRELRTGWDGSRDAFGRLEPGWSKVGLPVETGLPEGQTYADVQTRRR